MLIPKHVLEVFRGCDVECARYALGGVLFHRDADGRPWAVSTDSRKLFCFNWDEHEDTGPFDGFAVSERRADFRLIVPALIVSRISDAMPKRVRNEAYRNAVLRETADGTVEMTACDGDTAITIRGKEVEGKFPRYAEVFVPEDEIQLLTHLDPSHLTEVSDVFKTVLSQESGIPVEIGITSHDKAVRFAGEHNGIRLHVLLMPKADDDGVKPQPINVPVPTAFTPKPEQPKKPKPKKVRK